MNETKLLYRVAEAAPMLSLSRAKVFQLIRSGALPSVKVDGSRLIKAADLRAFVANLGEAA